MGSVADEEEELTRTPNSERPTSNAERGGRGGWAWRLVGIAVGGVFVYAGVLKAADPARFASDIENYHILPWALGVRMAFYLPWLEILCGLALIVRRIDRGAAVVLTGLMLTFIGATIAAKARGIDITCGCFGHASQNWSFPAHMAIDVALLGALAALVWRTRMETKRAHTLSS